MFADLRGDGIGLEFLSSIVVGCNSALLADCGEAQLLIEQLAQVLAGSPVEV